MLSSSHIDCEYHTETDEWDIHIKGIRETNFKFKLGVETPLRVTEDSRKVTVSCPAYCLLLNLFQLILL